MAFEPWNELDPAGGDPAGTIWDDIQQFKRQVRERLVGMFTDWSTATDRLTITKLFVNGTNGLTFRDSTDASDIGKITKDGYVNFLKPYVCSLYLASVYSGTPGPGNFKFSGTPTEIFDPIGMHSGANPWRITVPAGEGGIYKVILGATHSQTAGTLNLPHSFSIYKNGVVLSANGFNVPNVNGNSHWFSPIVSLAAGDYVEPYFSAYSSTTYSITDGYFHLERIS